MWIIALSVSRETCVHRHLLKRSHVLKNQSSIQYIKYSVFQLPDESSRSRSLGGQCPWQLASIHLLINVIEEINLLTVNRLSSMTPSAGESVPRLRNDTRYDVTGGGGGEMDNGTMTDTSRGEWPSGAQTTIKESEWKCELPPSSDRKPMNDQYGAGMCGVVRRSPCCCSACWLQVRSGLQRLEFKALQGLWTSAAYLRTRLEKVQFPDSCQSKQFCPE